MMLQIRNFTNNRNGNVGIIFGIMAMPLMMLAGVAIDYARISSAHGDMQVSVDNAIGSIDDLHSNRVQAEKNIAAMINVNSGRDSAKVDISIHRNKVRIEAVDVINTPILSFMGHPTSQVSVVTEIDGRRLEQKQALASDMRLNGSQKKQLQQAELRAQKMLRELGIHADLNKLSPQQQQTLLRDMRRKLENMKRDLR